MNVVVLSDHDMQGGAAIATSRVEASIAPVGTDIACVRRLVFFPEDTHRPITHLWHEEAGKPNLLVRAGRRFMPTWLPRPNTPEFAAGRLRNVLQALKPDVINVHNLHAAAPWGWGPHLIEVCLELAPVVWTLHDMWAFTGRCAYSYDCEKFIRGCDAHCPTPNESPSLVPAMIGPAWHGRRAIYNRHREELVIVTPSRWLEAQAKRGLFADHRVEVIPYGITHGKRGDLEFASEPPHELTEIFVPHPREHARRLLGIQPVGPVLLLAAVDLTERRKGAEILPRLWSHIQHRPLTILTMGRGTIATDDPLIEVRPLGWIDDDRHKALAYSATDALLHPAPVDNFPNVVLEAMACGTPTIAMPVGGVPEMVRPGVSGWLAQDASAAALGQAVNLALRDLALGKNLRESCRGLAEKEYSLLDQGRRYFAIFKELLRR